MKQAGNAKILLLLFLIPLAVYSFTFSPALRYPQNIDFTVSASGHTYLPYIVKPDGIPPASRCYTLWYLLASALVRIPAGSLMWRLGLLSAFFGALTVTTLYSVFLQYRLSSAPEIRTRKTPEASAYP